MENESNQENQKKVLNDRVIMLAKELGFTETEEMKLLRQKLSVNTLDDEQFQNGLDAYRHLAGDIFEEFTEPEADEKVSLGWDLLNALIYINTGRIQDYQDYIDEINITLALKAHGKLSQEFCDEFHTKMMYLEEDIFKAFEAPQ